MVSQSTKKKIGHIQREINANPSNKAITIQTSLIQAIIHSIQEEEKKNTEKVERLEKKIKKLSRLNINLKSNNSYYKKRYGKDLRENFKGTGPKKKS